MLLLIQNHLNVVKCLQEGEASVVSANLWAADVPLSYDLPGNSWAALFSVFIYLFSCFLH